MKRIALMLAMTALPAAAVAQTPLVSLPCMPQAQAGALVTFALPTLVEKIAKRCAPILPPNAYLIANAGALADRYRPDAAAAWPQARRAIARVFTQILGQPMPAEMDSDTIRLLAEPALGGLLAKQVKDEDCATADAAIAIGAHLSGRDVGRLAALAVAIADRKGNGIAGILKVCKPGDDR